MPERDDWETRHANFYNTPPFEAWIDPEKHLAYRDGRLKKIEKFRPIRDERGFIDIEELFQRVTTTLFRPEFIWRYDPRDQRTAPDDHHFYYDEDFYLPENNSGSDIPSRFRELPIHVGRMPRQVHKIFHEYVENPTPDDMPDMDAMADFVDRYTLAANAFRHLFLTARSTVMASHIFSARRLAVSQGLIVPKNKNPEDPIGEEFMRDFFSKHFDSYSRAIDEYEQIADKDIFYNGHEALKISRPPVVVKKLRSVVMRKSVVMNLRSQSETLAA